MYDTSEPVSNSSFNFQELLDAKISRPREIVSGLFFERSNAVLAAAFAEGKTMLALLLSLHLAAGRNFLGRTIPRPFKVLYVDFENDLGDIRDRVEKQKVGMKLTSQEVDLLKQNWHLAIGSRPDDPLYDTRLDKENNMDSLMEKVEQINPEVLFIDNLGRVTKGDVEFPQEAKILYANLSRLRKQSRLLAQGVIVLLHHVTKPSDSSAASLFTDPRGFLGRVRGTGRLVDFCESRLAMAEENIGGGTYKILHGIIRNAKSRPLVMNFNQETLSFEEHGNSGFRVQQVFANKPKKLEIYLSLPEEFTWTEAEALLGDVNAGTLSETLGLAVSGGLLHPPDERKRYRKIVPRAD
jgi:RecA-family ATPase